MGAIPHASAKQQVSPPGSDTCCSASAAKATDLHAPQPMRRDQWHFHPGSCNSQGLGRGGVGHYAGRLGALLMPFKCDCYFSGFFYHAAGFISRD
jgi:hypothetical protein